MFPGEETDDPGNDAADLSLAPAPEPKMSPVVGDATIGVGEGEGDEEEDGSQEGSQQAPTDCKVIGRIQCPLGAIYGPLKGLYEAP